MTEYEERWSEQLRSAARKLDRAWKASDPLKPLGLNFDVSLAIAEVVTAIHALDEPPEVSDE